MPLLGTNLSMLVSPSAQIAMTGLCSYPALFSQATIADNSLPWTLCNFGSQPTTKAPSNISPPYIVLLPGKLGLSSLDENSKADFTSVNPHRCSLLVDKVNRTIPTESSFSHLSVLVVYIQAMCVRYGLTGCAYGIGRFCLFLITAISCTPVDRCNRQWRKFTGVSEGTASVAVALESTNHSDSCKTC